MDYNIITMNRSRRGGGVARYIKKSISYDQKSSFCPNIESIFIEIFLPKSKPVLIGVLHRASGKPNFTEYLDNSFSLITLYLIGDFHVNLFGGNKMLLDKQYYDSYSQAPPLVKKYNIHLKKYMDICFSHSLHVLIAEPTRTTNRTETLTDRIFNELHRKKVIQSDTIEMGFI